MTLREFVNTMAFGILMGIHPDKRRRTEHSMTETYKKNYFFLPKVYCKDGFNISVQVNNGNYCGSEGGYRTFGIDWMLVEWGFPSEQIDAEKYNAEGYAYEANIDTTKSVGGFVDITLMEELIQEHGGIDLQTTLGKAME